MSAFTILELPHFADARGDLTVLDKDAPFPVRRAFWITGADGQTRGGHRHKKTRQLLIAISGIVTVHMDDGATTADVRLDNPRKALLVEPSDWHTMSFAEGAVLLSLASEPYEASDYISDPYRKGAP